MKKNDAVTWGLVDSINSIVLKIMKISFFLLLVCTFGVNAAGFSQTKISITADDSPIRNVLREIESKSDYTFFYNEDFIDLNKKITYSVENESVVAVLENIAEKTGLDFKMLENNLVVITRESSNNQEISGKVTNEKGEPIPGVAIVIKGTTNGTITDINGNYSLDIPSDAKVLVFSCMGMKAQEITLAGQTSIDVVMQEESVGIEGVVVIGYGEKKRVNMTGSVASVDSKALESRPITNTVAAIQGILPGLVVQRYSGQPGAEGFDLNVRGFSSTNGGNSPLVLIDGVAGSLELLNPADIESINVLKDASASIYGARAANGVFLVTTKKGKKGAAKITYSNNFAITKLAGMMETPTNYEMALMDNEANIHNGAAPMYTPELLEKTRIGDPNPIPHPVYGSSGWMLFFTNTDWKKAVFENGFQQKHTINISGGGENSSYYISGSFADQQGVIRYGDDNNKKYNLRMNYDFDFSKRIRLETKLSLDNQNRSDIGGVGASWIMYETIFGMPNHPIYTQSGEKYFAQGGWGNAVAQAKEGATASYMTRNINTNFKLIVDVLDGLKLNFQSGLSFGSNNNKDIANSTPLYTWDESSIAYYSIANPDQTWVYQYNSSNVYQNFTGYFNYDKLFGKHKIEIMGGGSYEKNDFDDFSAGRTNFVTNDLWALRLGSTGNMTNNGGGNQWAIGSVFSRISYDYDNKYLLEANLRYDGSSRFSPDTRWGLFPGVSVGWRMSEENFIKDLGLFDNLKIRASYGETGNQEGINLYDYYQLISVGRGYPYPFGAGGQDQSAYLSGMVSSDRTWETVAISNVGVDFSILKSRLDFTFDYFIKRNINMLIPVTFPSMLGAIPPATNAGELKTKGFETTLRWKDHFGDFQYSVRAMLSDATNELVNYGGQDTYTLGLNAHREGYPINTYFAYQFDGLIRTQAELDEYKLLGGVPTDIGIGDARFKDINGDGKISIYSDVPGEDGDVINAGSTTPRYTYGLNLDVKWKNFDLGIFMQGVGERTMFREGDYSMPWSDWWRQPPSLYFNNTWNEDRPNAEYPRLSHGNIRYWNYQASTLQKINAAYLRLKNLQIGYSLPETLLKKISVDRARVYFSGFDLWERHHVKGGWDPESSNTGFNYPFQRLYSFGIDVTF